jgi:hypothetical protein
VTNPLRWPVDVSPHVRTEHARTRSYRPRCIPIVTATSSAILPAVASLSLSDAGAVVHPFARRRGDVKCVRAAAAAPALSSPKLVEEVAGENTQGATLEEARESAGSCRDRSRGKSRTDSAPSPSPESSVPRFCVRARGTHCGRCGSGGPGRTVSEPLRTHRDHRRVAGRRPPRARSRERRR